MLEWPASDHSISNGIGTRAPEKTKKYKIASDCAAASVVADIHLSLGSLSCGVTV